MSFELHDGKTLVGDNARNFIILREDLGNEQYNDTYISKSAISKVATLYNPLNTVCYLLLYSSTFGDVDVLKLDVKLISNQTEWHPNTVAAREQAKLDVMVMIHNTDPD